MFVALVKLIFFIRTENSRFNITHIVIFQSQNVLFILHFFFYSAIHFSCINVSNTNFNFRWNDAIPWNFFEHFFAYRFDLKSKYIRVWVAFFRWYFTQKRSPEKRLKHKRSPVRSGRHVTK